jgi:DNA excision repair protein ERCC-3
VFAVQCHPPPTGPQLILLVCACCLQYGKAKLVLKHNKFYVESEFPLVLQELLRDPTIAQARVHEDVDNLDEHGFISQTKAEEMKENLQILREPDDSDDEAEESATQKVTTVVSFQIKSEEVEKVKRQSAELDYPLMEEYDFKNDVTNANVPQMDLKPHTRIRRYQERSLAKMFGNGRARSVRFILNVQCSFYALLSH